MDAVLLAACSAALFGAMTVALRLALQRVPDVEVGALVTIAVALAVALAAALPHLEAVAAAWPFALAGVLGPGVSQLLFTFAVRDAGPSRTSVVVGTAPLFSVAIAVALLAEPLEAALLLGALLIVAGGVLLAAERDRPEQFRALGLALAFASTLVFASRDNLLRWLSLDTDVPPSVAAAVTLAAGAACVLGYIVATRGRGGLTAAARAPRHFLPAGLLFGLSYVALFEAYYRGRVTVVSPIVATESLFGVVFSALLLRGTELVGPRLVAGAVLVVAGGAVIGVFR